MSGYGERFKRAGYKKPKPLIEVEGKPIIAHVIDMFGIDNEFVFICNEEHLKSTNMESLLNKYAPNNHIVEIQPHKKGPVFAVEKSYKFISSEEPVIVNYCDFTCYWSFKLFKNWLEENDFDGVIPSYKDFHPHSLGSTNYAYLKVSGEKVLEVQEKKPYTNNRMQELASSGTYYFRKGSLVKRFFTELIKEKIDVNGEYYCSLVYNLMIKNNFKVGFYELEHFMQWGTPQDLEEYKIWSKAFKGLLIKNNKKYKPQGSLVLPMAGKGKRFIDEGYKEKKPLIKINNKSMFLRAINSMPNTLEKILIVQGDQSLKNEFNDQINFLSENNSYKIVNLGKPTIGQAISCIEGLKNFELKDPITITACDHACLFDTKLFLDQLSDKSIDVIVWGYRNHVNALRNPNMYGWIDQEKKVIKKISVKKPLGNPDNDPIVIGTFTFRNYDIFKKSVNLMVKKGSKVNGEFYIDTAINDAISLGYKCVMFEIDHYFCWGTPNELKTFQYWQSCFNKWSSHPYKIENDKLFNS